MGAVDRLQPFLNIEEKYRSTAIYNMTIDGYDTETVAYHRKILYEAGLIKTIKLNLQKVRFIVLELVHLHGMEMIFSKKSEMILIVRKSRIQLRKKGYH